MSELKPSDLDMEQQAKFDKELAWCIRKLYSKLEHEKKDNDKKINEIIKSINTLKNPSELLIKKRQVMFKMLGDYRAKMKAEESKKPLAKDEMKVKFLNDEGQELKNSKYIKKSHHKTDEPHKNVETNLKNLNLNDKKPEENYFKMESDKTTDFKFNFEVE
ncbi:unnamed protein product [Brachionus calyciflorus]|uniref:Uncharacterized protein n=1 Tax=Brachionus calyciflorus TaxID=104777 RepID=A0A813M6N3_9BILA|nr:unnamed protein product [Brachionus calyciflorus]